MTTTEAAVALREICSDLEAMNADPTMIDRLSEIADGIKMMPYWCMIHPASGRSVYLYASDPTDAVDEFHSIVRSDEYIDGNGRDDLGDDGFIVSTEALDSSRNLLDLKRDIEAHGWRITFKLIPLQKAGWLTAERID